MKKGIIKVINFILGKFGYHIHANPQKKPKEAAPAGGE